MDQGLYAGVCGGALIVTNDSGEHAIALDAIRELRVSNGPSRGVGLETGFLIGAAVDVTIVLVVLGKASKCPVTGC